MNRTADQVQELQRAISEKEARHSSEMAELRKRLSDEQARANMVQPIVPTTPNVLPSVAPGQGLPSMATNKNSLIAVANSISRLFKVANIDENSPDAQSVANKLLQIGMNDTNEIPNILKLLDEARMKLEQAIGPVEPAAEMPQPVQQDISVQQSSTPSLSKSAGENPFAKKEDDKKEEPKEEDKKEDDKPGFPMKKEEDKADKKEDKPEEKKEEKAEPKKEDKPEPKKEEKKSEPKKKDKEEEEKESYEMSKSEEKGAKKAVKIIEDLIKKEKKEGLGEVAPLEEALEAIKEFLFEEKKEHGMDDLPEMEMGLGLPGISDKPALEMKDPHKEDILKTGPAVPLPPMLGVDNVDGPALGLEKNLHPITNAKPLGPVVKKLPIIDKAPKMDMAKEMGNMSSFNINDRVWTKSAGESYEIDDEPGRIVAIAADGKIVVDWGEEIPTEEKPEDLVVAKSIDNESNMFDAPPVPEEVEVAQGLNAFTPTSMNVEKALSLISFADAMANHIKAVSDGKNGANGTMTFKFDEPVIDSPFEIK